VNGEKNTMVYPYAHYSVVRVCRCATCGLKDGRTTGVATALRTFIATQTALSQSVLFYGITAFRACVVLLPKGCGGLPPAFVPIYAGIFIWRLYA